MISLGLGLLVVAGLLVPIVAWAVGRAVRWPRSRAVRWPGSGAVGSTHGGAVGSAVRRTLEPEPHSGVPWPRLVIGAVAFIGASIVQNILVAPVALVIHGPHGLQPLIPGSPAEAVYYGFAAGLAQEGAKLAGSNSTSAVGRSCPRPSRSGRASP